ncbi:MAG: heavy metal translocating P-type ATPase, partial [Methanobacteriota archaeon]
MPTDPVCGMFVQDRSGTPRILIRGNTYLFCSDDCLRRFTAPEREAAATRRRAIAALGAGVALFVLARLPLLSEPTLGYVLLAVGTVVQAYAGLPFYLGLRHAVAARAPNVDSLVALGTTAAWLFGAIEVVRPELLSAPGQTYYFDVGALVLGFLLAGRALEHRMRHQARDAVAKLLDLQPPTARRVRDGAETVVPAASVAEGDLVRVGAGE